MWSYFRLFSSIAADVIDPIAAMAANTAAAGDAVGAG